MISLALKKCLDNGVKIYPVHRNYKWYIEVSINGKTKTIEKSVSQSKINEAMAKTVEFYANKL